jgi:hypothetical protein
MTTSLTQSVPASTVVSITVQQCAVDANGNLWIQWAGLDGNGVSVLRQMTVLSAAQAASALQGPASALLAAAEAALAPIIVAAGSVSALPAGPPNPVSK